MYYGLDDETGGDTSASPIDIDGAHFDSEIYLTKLMREKRLTELVDQEVDMVKRESSLIKRKTSKPTFSVGLVINHLLFCCFSCFFAL